MPPDLQTLEAGESRVVFLPATGTLHPRKTGGSLRLLAGTALIDTLTYPALAAGQSYAVTETAAQTRCRPSPGADGFLLWEAGIVLQSGQFSATGKTSINIQLAATDGTAPASCHVDFGDGKISDSCNPPSHSYPDPGNYLVSATMQSPCGDAVERTVEVSVQAPASSSPSVSATTVSSQEMSYRSSSSIATVRGTASGLVLWGALPNPAGTDTGNEWVEIKNILAIPLVSDGWVIEPLGGKPLVLSGSIAAGAIRRILLPTFVILKNGSGGVALRAPSGNQVDVLTWTDAEESRIYGKYINNNSDLTEVKNSEQNFSSSLSASGSSRMDIIRITELYPAPGAGGEEWIELYNPSDAAVPLHGFLDDAEGGSTPWKFPALTLEAGEIRVFSGSVTKLRLNDGGDEARILAEDGTVMSSVAYTKVPLRSSYARSPDQSGELGEWCVSVPSPGTFGSCVPAKDAAKAQPKKTAVKAKAAARPVVRARVTNPSSPKPSESRSALLAALGEEPDSGSGGSSASFSWLWILLLLVGNGCAGYAGSKVARFKVPFLPIKPSL